MILGTFVRFGGFMLVYGRGTFIDLHGAATWREGDLVERCMAIVGMIYFNYIGASLASGHNVNTYIRKLSGPALLPRRFRSVTVVGVFFGYYL